MSPNRRIFLNIVVTYGRSLYTIAIGLFCGRWTLMALGQTDYGLMGLVGGMVVFVTFFNALLSDAVCRFYAVSVGAAKNNPVEGLENCRKWFNTALLMHTVVPTVLMAVGYPLGMWAVEHFLVIPPDRVAACRWVWRFSCMACFVSMVNVPFRAMYIAKQEIAELTIYAFATTTLNAVFLYYMVIHPAVWLTKFACWTFVLAVVPQVLINIFAFVKYPECRLRRAYLWDRKRTTEVLTFAAAEFLSGASGMIMNQGQVILVNKFMGPIANAGAAIGGTVAMHAMSLSASMDGAMWPAIANKAGEGDMDKVRGLNLMICRLSSILILVFAIPLSLEVSEVLRLWLKVPPPYAAEICVAGLCAVAFEKMTQGMGNEILAIGRGVMKYSRYIGLAGIIDVAVIWLCFSFGFKMWSVVVGIGSYGAIMVVTRLVTARMLIGFPARVWVSRVFAPIVVTSVAAAIAGLPTRLGLDPSFLRVVATTICCEAVFLPAIWFVVLGNGERDYLRRRILVRLPTFRRGNTAA